MYTEQNDYTLSDHYLIEASLKCAKEEKTERRKYTCRPLTTQKIECFTNDLEQRLCNTTLLTTDEKIEHLFTATTELLNIHLPLQKRSAIISNKPFTSRKISDSKKLKRRAERKFLKSKSDKDKQELNLAARNLSKVVRMEYNEFYADRLKLAQGDAKGTFAIINSLMNKTKKKILPDFNNSSELAYKFQNFFCDKIKNIRNTMNISNTCSDLINLNSVNINKFYNFRLVSAEELENVLLGVKSKFSTIDNIPSKIIKPFLKSSFNEILEIINSSLQSGIFPDQLKRSNVTPIPKSTHLDHNLLSTFRPIFDISILSKILEKCGYFQILEHLELNNLMIINQSAYRKGHSCETAMLRIYNDCLSILDSTTNVVVALLDFSAAYDTISHELLLQKLENLYGISGAVLNWLTTYLNARKLQVKIGDFVSEGESVDYGVPQGSVLGPLLFCLYVQDITKIIEKYGLKFHIYADDIQIYTGLSTIDPKLKF